MYVQSSGSSGRRCRCTLFGLGPLSVDGFRAETGARQLDGGTHSGAGGEFSFSEKDFDPRLYTK